MAVFKRHLNNHLNILYHLVSPEEARQLGLMILAGLFQLNYCNSNAIFREG